MMQPFRKALAAVVLDEYGITYSEELRIHIEHNTPSPLFQLLCYSLVSDAGAGDPENAFRLLSARTWTTARKTAGADPSEVAAVLKEAGFGAHSGSVAAALIDCAATVQDQYAGDLRNLRESAEHNPEQERLLLAELRGMGTQGVNTFFREVQTVWSELFPFADPIVLEAAARLELGRTAEDLRRLVDVDEYVRLAAGLVRVSRQNSFGSVRSRVS